ncbi:MAG: FecR domain-containing protein [Thauera sp.]|nr:FecR domain-containing protein [Thauera sp.]
MTLNKPSSDGTPVRLHDQDADEREFEAFARAHDRLDIEAAAWAARRRDGLDPAGEAALQRWLGTGPRHRAAFEDMTAMLDRVGRLPCDAATLCPPQRPASARVPHRPEGEMGRRRRPGLPQFFPRAAVAALAFVVCASGLGWKWSLTRPTFEHAYATERGQQLSLHLPDAVTLDGPGSLLQLDTLSQADVRLYRDRREVRLQQGQAMFAVQSDPQRPFQVRVGPLQITVIGTRFSARHTASGLNPGRTVIVVEEGRVSVSRGDRRIELGAGQMLVADGEGHLAPVAAPPDAVAPWRNGRLSFDQTPLAEALAEFERYDVTGVIVRDPAVAKLPVGGSYKVEHFERFVKTLPKVLPVDIVQRDSAMEIVAR